MKKKISKKLTLSKDTLRNLEVHQLGLAVGASTPEAGCTGVVCPYSAPYYCPRMPATRTECY